MPDNRLLVESSPSPGEKPGFLPQHRLQGGLTFEETTGKNGHLNVRNEDGEMVSIGAKADAAVTNPASAASLIAAVKGLLTLASAALPAGDNNIGNVDVVTSALPTGAATAAKQDTLIAKDFATQTTLAAILAKMIAAPATEATLAAILAKLIASPATEASLAALLTSAGAKADAAVTDPTASAALTQLLKGLLKQLQGSGSGAAPVALTGSIAETPTRPNVTTVSAVVLAANANRKYAYIRNPNPVDVYISKGATAVVGQQRAIPANGGVWTMSAALGNLSTGAIVGVHGATGMTYQLEVIEGV